MVWKRGRDSNPRQVLPCTRFQDGNHKPLGHLSFYFYWNLRSDSNRQSSVLQTGALTNLATEIYCLVLISRLELERISARGFKPPMSTFSIILAFTLVSMARVELARYLYQQGLNLPCFPISSH